MPFFSFRRDRTPSAKSTAAAASTESVEVVRKRARQRLIGASILVLIAVVGFPLIFDSQPRPVPVDIAIEIPSRSAVKPGTPIAAPAPAAVASAPAPATTVPQAPAAAVPAASEPAAPPEATKPAAQSAVPAPASLQEREEIAPKAAGAPATPAPRAEANRAQNLLEGKSGPAASSLRVVVQVGAFADPAKAREARQKLEKAGIKSYTQVVDTKDGQRTRVRAGPFSTREEAEQVAAKIRSLDLPASIRTL
jgi:DedD protein